MEIFKLFGSVFLNTDEADRELEKTGKKAEGFASKLGSLVGGAAKVGAGIAVGVGAGAGTLVALANKTAEATDRIDKMSQKLGMSREGFQEWDYILDQNGASIDSMKAGMKTLTSQFDMLTKDGKNATEAFGALGLSQKDLAGLSQEKIFEKTVIALQNMEDETQRAAIANQLLGRAGAELAPTLNAGAGSVEELKKQAKDLGLVISDDAVDAGVKWNDMLTDLKRSFSAVVTKIGASVLPLVQKLADLIIENMPILQEVIQKVVNVISNLVKQVLPILIKLFNNIIQDILPIFLDLFNNIIQDILPILIDLFMFIVKNILPVFNQLLEFVVQDILPVLIDLFKEIIKTVLPPLMELFEIITDDLLPVFIDLFIEVLQAVLPPLIDIILDLLPVIANLIDLFKEMIKTVLPPLTELFEIIINDILPIFIDLFIEVLQAVLPDLIDIILDLLPVITDLIVLLTDMVKVVVPPLVKIIEFLADVLNDRLKKSFEDLMPIIENIKNIFNNLIDFIKNIFSAEWDDAWQNVVNIFSNIWHGIDNVLKIPLNALIEMLNTFINGVNEIKIPDWIPEKLGGGKGLNIPLIPELAEGGNIKDDGWAIVGERGPELISNMKGATVTPLNKTGGINLTINAKLFNESDADKLGDLLINRLKILGVT